MIKKKRLLNSFYIRDKKGQKVKFRRNRAQAHYAQHKTGRDFILKSRKLGFTTEIQLNHLEKSLRHKYLTSATISHKEKFSKQIFRIAKFAWDNLDEDLRSLYRARYDNVRELMFSTNQSNYYVDIDTRGDTIHNLHISELAHHPDPENLVAGSMESVPDTGTIQIETTANGMNYVFDFWNAIQAGDSEFAGHFYNWTWADEYAAKPPENNEWKDAYRVLARQYDLIEDIDTRFNLSPEQFYWYFIRARRLKRKIKQEFPTTADEAFLSESDMVFNSFLVSQMQSKPFIERRYGGLVYEAPIPGHNYMVGVDTAEGKDKDFSSIEVVDITEATYKEVFSLKDSKIIPTQLAEKAISISTWYNNGFLVPERNGSGISTVLKIDDLGYKNVFKNVSMDKITQRSKNELGWTTTGSNRDLMIDEFIDIWENGDIDIRSINIIGQMKQFVRKTNGRREHADGAHDDNLFAIFLALQGRKYYRSQQSRVFINKAI